jgi:hypothetical protein
MYAGYREAYFLSTLILVPKIGNVSLNRASPFSEKGGSKPEKINSFLLTLWEPPTFQKGNHPEDRNKYVTILRLPQINGLYSLAAHKYALGTLFLKTHSQV